MCVRFRRRESAVCVNMCVLCACSDSPLPPVIQHLSGDGCFLHKYFPCHRMWINNAGKMPLLKSCQVTQSLELVQTIKMLLTFSDQRMTFLLGILNGRCLVFLSKHWQLCGDRPSGNQRGNGSQLDVGTMEQTMYIYIFFLLLWRICYVSEFTPAS